MDGARGRGWWEQFLRRTPVKETTPCGDVFRFFAPPKRRSGYCSVNVPAQGALVASGLVYYPPISGARIRGIYYGSDVAPFTFAARAGYVTAATLAAIFAAQAGSQVNRSTHADTPLRGTCEGFAFPPGLGDLWALSPGNSPVTLEVEVFQPRLFVVATRGDNELFEGGLYVEEFVDDTLLNT
jgi:hypothetical protein